jgi:ParB family chromosome partitioning protein
MNAIAAVSTQAAPVFPSTVREIPLNQLSESKSNPRRQFDEKKLAELADNIKQHGVLQPILVRPRGDNFEVVAGTRRYRASRLAGRETIPATVRELTDTECLELQLIENLQRADVHELDEAQGYAALMELQPGIYTVEVLATKIGKSQAYVYGRLRLLVLIPQARQAFYEAKLSVAHAFELARLQPNDQQRALLECFPQHRTSAAVLKDKKAEASVTVRELRQWIEREVHLDLTNAPFDPQDETLLPQAGACARCPKRTGSNPLLFPEIRQKCICTDRECYRAKVEALVQLRAKPFEQKGEKPFRVSQAPSWQASGREQDALVEGQFLRLKGKEECPNAKPAVFIDGRNAGTTFYICKDEKCPVHSRATRYQPTPDERAQRSKELLAERIEKQSRLRILDCIRKKLPQAPSRADMEMIALDYFRRLGHDNHRRLSRVYGWQEKKSKTSWGATTVDYEKVGTAAIRAMSGTEVHQFLMVCALVPDLYCPGYDPRQPLAKESNLASAAARYKVNTTKITAAVRLELMKERKKKRAANPGTREGKSAIKHKAVSRVA